MKSSNNNINRNQKGTPQLNKRGNAPENKDNLDSRKREEQDFKGDDVTHNKKAQQTPASKKRN
jgi:hypothetical protein